MKVLLRAAAVAAFLLPLAVAPASAQDYRFDIGVNAGGAWYTDALDEDHLGEDVGDVGFEEGWLTGAQFTWWISDRFGLRANGAYNERPLEFEGEFDDDLNGEIDFDNEFDLVEDVNLWSGTGDLMWRFLGPNERDFLGIELLPYLALGAGAKWINPAGDNVIIADLDEDGILDEDEEVDFESGSVFAIGDDIFALLEETEFMGLAALGADIRLARNFALRLELGDRIWDAPIVQLDDVFTPFEDEEEDVGNVIHELYATLGTHFLFGLEEPEPVVIAPAPAPPPPPAPAEEIITVCVIDPTLEGGIREIDAIYVPSTGDTLVVVNGRRVSLEMATRDVVVARDADWFIAGEPLTLTTDDETAEFVTFGGARIIEPEDLAFLGTVNGVPVYANAEEVQDINEELLELSDADDLEDALEQRDDLREDFEDIEVLYVPLQPVDCVFQPIRRVEEVRKVRG